MSGRTTPKTSFYRSWFQIRLNQTQGGRLRKPRQADGRPPFLSKASPPRAVILWNNWVHFLKWTQHICHTKRHKKPRFKFSDYHFGFRRNVNKRQQRAIFAHRKGVCATFLAKNHAFYARNMQSKSRNMQSNLRNMQSKLRNMQSKSILKPRNC